MRLLARAEPAGLSDKEQHFGKPVDRAAHGVAADTNRELGAAAQADQVDNARGSFAAPARAQQLARCPPSVNFLRRLPTAALLLSLPRCCSPCTDRVWPAFRAAAG